MTKRRLLFCSDFEVAPIACCSSCHEDDEWHGYSLCEPFDGIIVCCAVSSWIIENCKSYEEAVAKAESLLREERKMAELEPLTETEIEAMEDGIRSIIADGDFDGRHMKLFQSAQRLLCEVRRLRAASWLALNAMDTLDLGDPDSHWTDEAIAALAELRGAAGENPPLPPSPSAETPDSA